MPHYTILPSVSLQSNLRLQPIVKAEADRNVHEDINFPTVISKTKLKRIRKKKVAKLPPLEIENIKTKFQLLPPIIPEIDRVEIWLFGESSPLLIMNKNEKIENATQTARERLGCKTHNITFHDGKSNLKEDKLFLEELHRFPAKIYAIVSPAVRQPASKYRTTKGEDCLMMANEGDLLVSMPCRHIFAPDSLMTFCKKEIENKKWRIKCPAYQHITDGTDVYWEFSDIEERADMSSSERIFFEMMLSQNWILASKTTFCCIKCHKYVDDEESIDRKYFVCAECDMRFCKSCLDEISSFPYICLRCDPNRKNINDRLSKCEKINIIGLKGCPSIRMCPNCSFLIEFMDAKNSCKHMTCCECNCKFCFICLQIKPDSELYYPCVNKKGGAHEQCIIAPVQYIE